VVKILTDLIDEYLKTKLPKSAIRRNHFFISEASRKPFDIFKNLTFGNDYPPKMRRLFEIGKATHRRLCRYLKEMGVLIAEEVPVGDELFKGVVDAVIKVPGEEAMPLEIKTVGRKEFDRIIRKGVPTWHSYVQFQLYLHFLNKERGRILFVEANTLEDYIMPLENYRPEQRMKEFTVRKNPEVIAETTGRFRKLREVFVHGGAMPG